MKEAAAHELAQVLKRLDLLTNWENRPRGIMRIGLGSMIDLSQRMGMPQTSFRSIHVTGTKGKGSVCALIDVGLRKAGMSVGRYSSPHIEHVNERVSIEGEAVCDAVLAGALEQALNAYEDACKASSGGNEASWFDVLTVSALRIFADSNVDWAVVEVGIGGRNDSTNVVNSEIAVITNVELEHTEVLGVTREAIALDKVGILKPRATLITTLSITDPAGRIVHAYANDLGCDVVEVTASNHVTIDDLNSRIAEEVLDALGKRGVKTRGPDPSPLGKYLLDAEARRLARLPGRREHLTFRILDDASRTIPVILDGAHVPFNLRAVLRDLRSETDLTRPFIAVVAVANDKNVIGLCSILCEHAASIICTTVPTSARHLSPQDISTAVTTAMPNFPHETIADPTQAFREAVRWASRSEGWILITGSMLLIGELRSAVRLGGMPAVPQ